MKKAIERNCAQKVKSLQAQEKKKANDYRKEVRGLIQLNAQNLKAQIVQLAQENLQNLQG